MADITHAEVQRWLTGLEPGTGIVLASAVKDEDGWHSTLPPGFASPASGRSRNVS